MEKHGGGHEEGGNERLEDDPGGPVVCTQIEIIRGIERRAERPMSIWHGRSISRHGHRSIAREGTARKEETWTMP